MQKFEVQYSLFSISMPHTAIPFLQIGIDNITALGAMFIDDGHTLQLIVDRTDADGQVQAQVILHRGDFTAIVKEQTNVMWTYERVTGS